MARWRLTQPHYLNVPGTNWEHKEIDKATGKQLRQTFPVPTFLNPFDQADHNYPGEVIVAKEASREHPRDVVFVGDPTPDMEPIDDEAVAISKTFEGKWQHPIDSLPAEGFSAGLISQFEKQLTDAMRNAANVVAANPISTKGASIEEVEALKEQIAKLTAQIAEGAADKAEGRRL